MAGAARELSCLLGGVPLALCGAGGYLGSPVARHTATELAVHLAGTPRNQVGMDPHLRVGPTWRLSLDALAEGGSSCAWRLLGVLAYDAPERTVADDVLAGEQLVQCGLTPTSETTPAEWKSALDGLVAVGLVDRTVTVGQKVHGVTVHPLVAEVVLDEVPGRSPASVSSRRPSGCCARPRISAIRGSRPTGPTSTGWSPMSRR